MEEGRVVCFWLAFFVASGAIASVLFSLSAARFWTPACNWIEEPAYLQAGEVVSWGEARRRAQWRGRLPDAKEIVVLARLDGERAWESGAEANATLCSCQLPAERSVVVDVELVATWSEAHWAIPPFAYINFSAGVYSEARGTGMTMVAFAVLSGFATLGTAALAAIRGIRRLSQQPPGGYAALPPLRGKAPSP